MAEPPDIDRLLEEVYGSDDQTRRDRTLEGAVHRLERVTRPGHQSLGRLQRQAGRREVDAAGGLPSGPEPAGEPAPPVAAAPPAASPPEPEAAEEPTRTMARLAVGAAGTAPLAAAEEPTRTLARLPVGAAGTAPTAAAGGAPPPPAAASKSAGARAPADAPTRPADAPRPAPAKVISGEGADLVSTRYADTQIVRRRRRDT